MKKIIKYNNIYGEEQYKVTFKGVVKQFISVLYAPICSVLLLCFSKKQVAKKFKVSVCAIFKNEALFLREWICYHQLIGVEHFYLYNNFSDDNYKEILQPFVDSGIVTIIDWTYKYGQMKAYSDCINRFSAESNWIAFIDLDEYICLRKDVSIINWLKSYKRYPSIILNWKMFGTSGVIERDPKQLIIEQFSSSWAEYTDIGKSIINTSYQFKPCDHVHIFTAKIAGFPIFAVDEFKHFVINWVYKNYKYKKESMAQINHYWSKSYNDFIYKDTVRGSANSAGATDIRKNMIKERFFYHEAHNTVRDYTIQRFVIALKKQLGLV